MSRLPLRSTTGQFSRTGTCCFGNAELSLDKGDNTENPQLSLFPDEGAKKDKDFAERTDILFRLKEKLEEALQEVGLYKLYEEIEMPLVSVLADMEYEGVSIDKVALDDLSED